MAQWITETSEKRRQKLVPSCYYPILFLTIELDSFIACTRFKKKMEQIFLFYLSFLILHPYIATNDLNPIPFMHFSHIYCKIRIEKWTWVNPWNEMKKKKTYQNGFFLPLVLSRLVVNSWFSNSDAWDSYRIGQLVFRRPVWRCVLNSRTSENLNF